MCLCSLSGSLFFPRLLSLSLSPFSILGKSSNDGSRSGPTFPVWQERDRESGTREKWSGIPNVDSDGRLCVSPSAATVLLLLLLVTWLSCLSTHTPTDRHTDTTFLASLLLLLLRRLFKHPTTRSPTILFTASSCAPASCSCPSVGVSCCNRKKKQIEEKRRGRNTGHQATK